jgi:hypothetical protein
MWTKPIPKGSKNAFVTLHHAAIIKQSGVDKEKLFLFFCILKYFRDNAFMSRNESHKQ